MCNYKTNLLLFEKEIPQAGLYKLLRCRKCGLCFVHPIPPIEIQRLHYKTDKAVIPARNMRRAEKKISRFEHPIRRWILRESKGYGFYEKSFFLSKLAAHIFAFFTLKDIIPLRGEGRILDVGCNDGLFLYIHNRLGWKTFGVEPEFSLCEKAKELGIDVFCGTLEESSFPSSYFDIIRFNQAFEHIPNPMLTLQETKRILNDKGTIYIEVPNQRSFSFYVFREDFYGTPMHLYIFSPKTFSLLCKKVGLKAKKIKIRCSVGFFVHCLELRCKDKGNISKIILPIIKSKIFKALFVRPFLFILSIFRFGDIFAAEISHEKDAR